MQWGETLMNKTILLVVLFVGSWLMAQANPDQSQHPPDEKKGQVTVQGCVSRSSGDFVLMQSDPGNSYVLHATNKINLGHYLGQQVAVTGTESPTMSSSSDAGKRGSSVTIMVDSINAISKQCKTR
jgi:hypothetical protein